MKYLFCGHELSEYEIEAGYVSYGTLAKAFDKILCNSIYNLVSIYEMEVINGDEYDDEDNPKEFFQYYIIDEYGSNILRKYTNEVVYYINSINLYIWAIDHFGTSWDYVMTEIPIDRKDDAERRWN